MPVDQCSPNMLCRTSPALNPSSAGALSISKSQQPTLSTAGSQIPWRRSNVRHTSNELYVDIVETLSVTYAPSGRPLAAFANGSIAFTSKVSGVPDLLLVLTTGSAGGMGDRGQKVRRAMERPAFHPCVRLARWKDHGELSFIPPDGRFVLAGYEVDLLDSSASLLSAKSSDLKLPATIDVRTGLGSSGNDFEVKLTLNHRYISSGGGGTAMQSLSSHMGRPVAGTRSTSTDAKVPLIEDLMVSVPIPTTVRNISEMRPSKGEAHWSPGDAAIEWSISVKDAAGISSAGAVLRCTVVGPVTDSDETTGFGLNGATSDTYDYDEGDAYQSAKPSDVEKPKDQGPKQAGQNAMLMPTSASVSFGVKGWLASGLKVDTLTIDTRKSKGLGEGVRPYKGVKYLTVSRGGIEVRC